MTISRRLTFLLALPLTVLVVLAAMSYFQAAALERRTRLVAETQIESLATIGRFSRAKNDQALHLRNCIISSDPDECSRARAAFVAGGDKMAQLLEGYSRLQTSPEDTRLYHEIRDVSSQYEEHARTVLEELDSGNREKAIQRLTNEIVPIGDRLRSLSEDWTSVNVDTGREAGAELLAALGRSRRLAIISGALAVALTGVFGLLVVRSIVRPLHGLRRSVESIAGGDYTAAVPSIASTNEIGALARSIEVLKNGAGAAAQQHWVKGNVSRIAALVQGAATTEEFGRGLLSELVPLMGGGVAALYVTDAGAGRLTRVAGFGLADAGPAEPIAFGQGLSGQCAQEARPVTLSGLPPEYLRVGSGLGSAPPAFASAWPLLVQGTPVAVLELATLQAPTPAQRALIDELLPVAALSLDVLRRNLRTRELLDVTQRQAADMRAQQESLRASEEQFRTLLEAAPDALIISDEQGKIVLVNAQTERLLGYRRDELVGQPVEMLVPERIRAKHPGLRRKYHDNPGVRAMGTGMELAAVRKDGTEFPVEISLSPLHTGDGRGTLVCSSLRDITERKRQQAELQTQHSALEAAANAIVITDRAGAIQWVNPAFVRLTGYEREEVLGQNPRVLNSGVHDKDLYQDLWQTILRGEVWHGTLTNRRKSGEHYQEEMTITPVRATGGEITHFVAVKQDITQRLAADAEIKRVNFLSDSALELTQAGYWHVPLDGSGWYISSERAARIFGDHPLPGYRYRLDEWAQHVKEGDEEAAKATMENFSAAVAGTIPAYDATYAYKRPVDGRVVWIHALGHVVKDAGGKPTDMFGVTQDITAFKLLENDLRQAMKRAEEATKAKGSFLANMSHEIRTPMNGIMGMTELALDTDLTAEQRDYLNTVKSSADALLSLINDILDFSKIEAGRIELDPVEFLLRDSMGDTLSPLSLRASAKGVELAYDVHPDVPDALIGDVYRLRQVIVNLAGNAIKFTERGEVVISVSMLERRGNDVTLQVAVRDTGIGISPEAAARLFKAFEQAESSTTRKYGGTGLGLAISKQLVELMGGQIRLESTPGVGSTFIFSVHFAVGTARPSASAEDAARVFHAKSALIVDDNETNRRILSTMLGHWGLRTIEADSGKGALAALDRASNAGQAVSLVITDLHMPEMDGFELCRAIRDHPRFGSLPIILLTSSASPGDQAICTELGVAARLLKPAKQSLLLDNIMRVLGATDRSRASVEPKDAASERPPGEARALRVLLAEDNPVNQKFAVRVLEGAGHSVVVANNGREALDRSGSDSFDLVLMDVQMPEMDGLDATREIRAREAGSPRRIPIIAMTANAMAGDREMCLNAGMDGYVTKPVKKEILFTEINRVLRSL